jgi:cytochrome b subunit of formate dehydrogenase
MCMHVYIFIQLHIYIYIYMETNIHTHVNSSTVGQEKAHNPRLTLAVEDFVTLMAGT